MKNLVRMLKLRDLELFRIDKEDNETLCLLLILDYRRPSTLDDFPILKQIEDESSFEGASNYINTLIITESPLTDEDEINYIGSVLNGLVEDNKMDCDNNNVFYYTSFPETYEPGPQIVDYLEPILKEVNFDIDLNNIKEKHFNFLTQE